MTDDLAAFLDAAEARAGRLRPLMAESADTILVLVAMVRAVLARHVNDEGDGIAQPFCVYDSHEWPCPDRAALVILGRLST